MGRAWASSPSSSPSSGLLPERRLQLGSACSLLPGVAKEVLDSLLRLAGVGWLLPGLAASGTETCAAPVLLPDGRGRGWGGKGDSSGWCWGDSRGRGWGETRGWAAMSGGSSSNSGNRISELSAKRTPLVTSGCVGSVMTFTGEGTRSIGASGGGLPLDGCCSPVENEEARGAAAVRGMFPGFPGSCVSLSEEGCMGCMGSGKAPGKGWKGRAARPTAAEHSSDPVLPGLSMEALC